MRLLRNRSAGRFRASYILGNARGTWRDAELLYDSAQILQAETVLSDFWHGDCKTNPPGILRPYRARAGTMNSTGENRHASREQTDF
jgi:hypothetical protein